MRLINVLGPDVITLILTFLPRDLLKQVLLDKDNLPHMHESVRAYVREWAIPTTHSLMYGQVQSGKTRKIMDHVQDYYPRIPKILVMQNSVVMLNQYIKALEHRNISYRVIRSNMDTEYKGEHVLLTIHNKHRIKALSNFINTNLFPRGFHLVLDESDQYLRSIQKQAMYQRAKHVMHVTATPFKYKKPNEIDQLIVLNPSDNYVGVHDVTMVEVPLTNGPHHVLHEIIPQHMTKIIQTDFALKPDGIMLITCFNRVVLMKSTALSLSIAHPTMCVIVISSNTYTYLNGAMSQRKIRNMQQLFDSVATHTHVILIANRLSNRGVNYTDSTYSRNISHQISMANTNYTSFIQKCRIFGTRTNIHAEKPILYCLVKTPGFVDKLKSKIVAIHQMLLSAQEPQEALHEDINTCTVKQLKQLCKAKGIRKYSKLRKEEIKQLIRDRINN